MQVRGGFGPGGGTRLTGPVSDYGTRIGSGAAAGAGATALRVLETTQRRQVAVRYCAFLACSENAAPCGSMAFTIQSPPGTSMGPLRICPPFALMRSIADVMSGTR